MLFCQHLHADGDDGLIGFCVTSPVKLVYALALKHTFHFPIITFLPALFPVTGMPLLSPGIQPLLIF